jgi:hypothetical protein
MLLILIANAPVIGMIHICSNANASAMIIIVTIVYSFFKFDLVTITLKFLPLGFLGASNCFKHFEYNFNCGDE